MAELHLIIAALFREYDVWDGTDKQESPTLQLYQTERADVDMASALILPFIEQGRHGVRVIVRAGKPKLSE